MSTVIAPLKQADLPDRTKSFWRMTGPGAVMVGMSIGAGELIVWPWITANFGASMVWAAALGVFLQLWINIEIGRWAIATGESVYLGFARLWKGYAPLFLFIGFVLVFLPAWARAAGPALRTMIFGLDGPGSDSLWTTFTMVAVAAVLFGPNTVYTAVERVISVIVLIIVLGLVFVAFRVGTVEGLADMGRGLLNFPHVELSEEFTISRFFGAVVFAGAGGLGNLWYAYYLRDKQIGMGARIARLENPLRAGEHAEIQTGFEFADTEDNRRRFREWFNFVKLDQTLYFGLLNTLTMFLFMFGALVVLYPLAQKPGEDQLVYEMSRILSESMGPAGRYLFMIIGIGALFSTQLTVVDGSARTFADLIHNNFNFGRRLGESKIYVWSAVFCMALGIGSTWVLDRMNVSALDFIMNSALISGFAMAVYTPVTLYLNMTRLPRCARPGPINIVMVGAASVVYIGFALFCIWDQFTV